MNFSHVLNNAFTKNTIRLTTWSAYFIYVGFTINKSDQIRNARSYNASLCLNKTDLPSDREFFVSTYYAIMYPYYIIATRFEKNYYKNIVCPDYRSAYHQYDSKEDLLRRAGLHH